MKDIETGKEIFFDTYVFIVKEEGVGVPMNHSTFQKEIDKNKGYLSENPVSGDDLVEQFLEEYLPCTYEVRELLTDKIIKSYPLLYIPKNGVGFRKTLEYFLDLEKIKIN